MKQIKVNVADLLQDLLDTVETLEFVVLSLLDGQDLNDVIEFTGLSKNECKELVTIKNIIHAQHKKELRWSKALQFWTAKQANL